MKKFILLTTVLFFAMSCEIKMKEVSANVRYGHSVFSVGNENYIIQYNTIEIDGMTYAVFGGSSGAAYGGTSVAVVNLTKEKLEIELLKKQLSK